LTNATRSDVESTEVDAALCRCVFYEALSVGLYTPSRDSVERLRSTETRAALVDAAHHLASRHATAAKRETADSGTGAPADGDPPQLEKRVEALATSLDGNLELEDLQSAYGRLFGHTARGAVCPYESEFGTETHFQQTARLANLGGFYAAFGLKLGEHTKERIDHVCSELEFLGFLARKEAFALQERDDAMLTETRKAVRLFLRDHLGRFGRAFARELSREDRGGFYARLADVLFDFLTLECARVRVQAGPSFVTLRPAEDDDASLECGGGCDPTSCEVPGAPEGPS
jgi:TorA maturation chaperone TorD